MHVFCSTDEWATESAKHVVTVTKEVNLPSIYLSNNIGRCRGKVLN